MRALKLFPTLAIFCLVTSCVTNKKFVLMQKDDVNKKDLPIDSVVRAYPRVEYEYHVQAEDILSVRFESLTPKDFDFLSQGQAQNQNINLTTGASLMIGELVDHNGEIPFPVLGNVKVAGMTVYQIQDKLQGISNQYLDSPVVKVRLINFRFSLLGEVNREGTTVLFNNRVNMLEAIALAGGMTDLADKGSVKLLRQRNGKTEVIYLNLLSEDFIESPYYYVYQNDILIVPALRQRPYRKYFGQNFALVVSAISLLILTITLSRTK
jgi:polysaccharide biosynthesis/export protein